MKSNKFIWAVSIIFILLLSACAQPASTSGGNEELIATVSVLPQKYFLDRIGGEHVSVNVMVGPGESPHSYEPKAAQMAALSKSAVYFKIGVEFENAWMDRIASVNPNMLIIDLSRNISKIEMGADIEQDHSDEEIDPHIWTSPANGAVIAQDVYETLAGLDPHNEPAYMANLTELLGDIGDLQVEISSALSGLDTDQFMVFHPAWGYFAHEFGLKQIPIEVGGTEPSAQELADIISYAKAESIQVIFAQPEFSTRSADYISSEIAGRVVLISPLAEDWLGNLRHVADSFAEVL